MRIALSAAVAAGPCSSTRCISTSAPPTQSSQQVRIGKRWREFQGANNWDGLLDPLDHSLRSELIRYGRFVQAAYSAFEEDPSSSSYAGCRFPKHSLLPQSGLPDTGYRVTRNLHASSAVRLPWEDIAPAWASTPTSWIGYAAVCQDEEEIARLGRRDAVIAFRGTITCHEWLENLRTDLTSVGNDSRDVMVERGFWSLYSSAGLAYRSLQEEVREEVARLIEAYGSCYSSNCRSGKQQQVPPLSITFTGHSLGAALATLAAYDITATFGSRAPHMSVFSFGGPRVGNARFRSDVESRGGKVLRVVNTRDIVTRVPGFFIDAAVNAASVATGLNWGGRGIVPAGREWLARAGQAYTDVGQELRVSCQKSMNVVACHDLGVYLQLLKQLKSSYPFGAGRADLQHQAQQLRVRMHAAA